MGKWENYVLKEIVVKLIQLADLKFVDNGGEIEEWQK